MHHGGMLAAARRLFPHAPVPLLDLSTGINPIAYPLGKLPEAAFTRLPDQDDTDALQRAAAQAYGVPDPAMVVAAPGTQILISLLPHLLGRPPGHAAILSPTYGEHAASWGQAGYTLHETTDIADLAQADIAVVCNPNNPDGRRIGPADLLDLADRMAAHGGVLVVDEAFADLEPPGLSLAAETGHKALIVLRSFGKSTGLAGLRLGFILTDPHRAARLRTAIGPWAVSGPALAAGLQALPDTAWRHATIARLDQDCARLDALLGLRLIGGTNLFRLYETNDAPALYAHLGEAGILVRRFLGQPDRLRFGLPGTEADWARLTQALHTAPLENAHAQQR